MYDRQKKKQDRYFSLIIILIEDNYYLINYCEIYFLYIIILYILFLKTFNYWITFLLSLLNLKCFVSYKYFGF